VKHYPKSPCFLQARFFAEEAIISDALQNKIRKFSCEFDSRTDLWSSAGASSRSLPTLTKQQTYCSIIAQILNVCLAPCSGNFKPLYDWGMVGWFLTQNSIYVLLGHVPSVIYGLTLFDFPTSSSITFTEKKSYLCSEALSIQILHSIPKNCFLEGNFMCA